MPCRPHFRFVELEREAPFWTLVGCFLTFFIGFQKPKHCNLQCFCAFGMEKVLLATC